MLEATWRLKQAYHTHHPLRRAASTKKAWQEKDQDEEQWDED